MLITNNDSDFNIINQTLLFHFINTPESEINFRFIESELIGLGCGKNFALSWHPHNFILNNIITEGLAEESFDVSSLIVSEKDSIFNYENVLKKNSILKSKKTKPKAIKNKVKNNKKAACKTSRIMGLAQTKSSIPKEILEHLESSPSASIHDYKHEYIKRINSLSEKSFCVLEENRKSPLLITDLKKIREALIFYFKKCHKNHNEAQGLLESILFKRVEFALTGSIEIYYDFIRIIKYLDKLNMRNTSIKQRLKVCYCTQYEGRKCPRPYFWASDVRNSIFYKCHSWIEKKREKIANEESIKSLQ